MFQKYRIMVLMLSLLLFSGFNELLAGAEPGLRTGASAPDFTATSYSGKEVTLSKLYRKGPIVLIFYRGDWCPVCNAHLRSFQERIAEFKRLGAQIVAVSVDKPEYERKTAQSNALEYEIISDPGADILKSYNVIYQLPADTAEEYRKNYHIDLEAHSGRKDRIFAVPATYVIDETGIIVFAYANEDYNLRTKPEEVLEVLRKRGR